jgi:hypothetical protein
MVSSKHRLGPKQKSPASGARTPFTACDANGGQPQSHGCAAAGLKPLLTPRDILARFSMTSTEPTKWMRRIFKKHGVPYVHACGQIRATEEQYQLLLEKSHALHASPREEPHLLYPRHSLARR